MGFFLQCSLLFEKSFIAILLTSRSVRFFVFFFDLQNLEVYTKSFILFHAIPYIRARDADTSTRSLIFAGETKKKHNSDFKLTHSHIISQKIIFIFFFCTYVFQKSKGEKIGRATSRREKFVQKFPAKIFFLLEIIYFISLGFFHCLVYC